MKAGARYAVLALAIAGLVSFISCSKGIEMQFKEFVDAHVAKLQPLEKEANLAYWAAALSGKEEDYKKYSAAQLKLEKLYTNTEEFAFVKRAKESGSIKDAQLQRTADILYLRYLGNQTDSLLLKQMIELASAVENKFTVYRPVIGGKSMTTNDVYRILGEEKNSAKRRETWEASKAVGPVVLEDLIKLVKLRNESAKKIGFDNYYTMSLTLAEQNENDLVKLFAELDELTRAPFLAMKKELDESLAKSYKVKVGDLRPWHYHDPYFQELPQVGEINLDKYYKGKDPVEIAKAFYASINLPADDIITRSDLYERPGKNPHAFCTDIDRAGDIRILANMKDNGYWMETILHELGHGVYDKNIDPKLPFLLRTYPHLCVTEASAEYFGRLSQDPAWMKAALGLSDKDLAKIAPVVAKSLRMKQLIFARWCQVMFNFERQLYKNPDQDLNKLWWDIVEQYQFVKRPEGRNAPDWATKIHIVTNPVYYHNYMLGELIASQLQHHILTAVAHDSTGAAGIYGKPAVGLYLKESVYAKGDIVPWNKLVELATGEPLTARYFAEQFVKGAN
ncbi:MAG: M2 family metallopeptidase [Candidatus Krumholzibacteriaceae bacterium]|jgi:peptidyl-dipeptidase A